MFNPNEGYYNVNDEARVTIKHVQYIGSVRLFSTYSTVHTVQYSTYIQRFIYVIFS